MSSYLVTGGAGFIGSHLVDHLVRQGHRVRVFDDLSTGKIEHIEHNLNKIDFLEGSIVDLDAVRKAVDGVDYILHHAAVASVPRSVNDPVGTNEVNITGTLNTLVAARDAGVKRLVFASSSAVYGDSPKMPKSEDMSTSPLSPYALHKLAGEYYCRMFSSLHGFDTICLRYFNVFGPRQDPNSEYSAVIPKFLSMLINNERPVIHGDGLQSRDFTHVENVVHANMLACIAPNVTGEVFNIACGVSASLLDLLDGINEALGTSVEPVFGPARVGDIKHSVADTEKAKLLLGYIPKTDFSDGLADLVSWFQSKKINTSI